MEIKWKVLHSPKFVSLMMFFSSNFCPHLQQPLSNLSAKKFKSIILLPISITFLLVGWYFKNRYYTCLGLFLLKRPTWSRPSEAIFVPTEAAKTFNGVTNRTSVYTYLPYTFLRVYIAEIVPNLATGQFSIFLNIEYNSKIMQNVDL